MYLCLVLVAHAPYCEGLSVNVGGNAISIFAYDRSYAFSVFDVSNLTVSVLAMRSRKDSALKCSD